MTESQKLLAEYVGKGPETAFRELVSRYVDLVYSTALRLVEGDAHRAQDVTQTVFIDLARQASKLSSDSMLGGWLHRDTCFVAAKVPMTD
jgi:DNA-directed RNA polymerase specialized sigma24 family protein